MSEQLVQLKPEQITLPELQIRHSSDSETIEALKESIRTLGLLQPIVVRRKVTPTSLSPDANAYEP